MLNFHTQNPDISAPFQPLVWNASLGNRTEEILLQVFYRLGAKISHAHTCKEDTPTSVISSAIFALSFQEFAAGQEYVRI